MPSDRCRYTITGDRDNFIVTAVADRLDDDPAVDKWQIRPVLK